MNVLQRKMFANGDVVNSPLVDVTAQIANLAKNGLAPIDIFELLQADYASKGLQMPPDLGMATIERISQQVGGKVKPDSRIVGPKRPLDPSRMDQIGIAPFDVNPNIAPNRLPPADPNLDPRLGTYAQQGNTLNPAAIPEITDLSIDMDELLGGQSVEDGLPNVTQEELGPNDIRLSDGRIIDFTQGISDIKEGKGQGAFLYRIYNSPDIETGSNVEDALVEFIKRDEPGAIRFFGEMGGGSLEERRGTAFGPEDFGSSLIAGAKGLFDIGSESLATLVPGAISPFVGRDTVENVREFFDVDFPEGYAARGGYSPEVIDNIVLQASGTEKDSIAKDLTDIVTEEKQTPKNLITPEEFLPTEEEQAEQEKAEAAEAARAEQPEVDTTGTSSDPKETGATGVTEDATGDQGVTPVSLPKTQETTFAEFTRSPDFIRFVRNIGKGLTTTGEIGRGIAVGSAAAAEEKALEEREDELSKAERDADLMEILADSGLEFKDRKDILQVQSDMSASIRDYNNAIAAEELARSVINFAKNGDLTTFASKIGAKASDLRKAFTGEPGELSDTKRAQIALDILTNRNIKEILGESGRTISNIDRDIAQRIVGNLNLSTIQSVEEVRNRLEDNIKSIVQKKNEAQRNIKNSVIFLAPYGSEAPLDKETVTIFMSELGQSLPQNTQAYTPTPGVTFIDATK
jgi:hypothetical protein